MKKSLLFFCAMLISSVCLAQNISVDNISYAFINDPYNPSLKVISPIAIDGEVTPYSGDIVIPSYINRNGREIPISTIASSAFENSAVTSVTIPESVTSIESYAFSGCKELSSVTIPENLTSIETGTFWGCSSLSSLSLGANIKTIGYQAFYNSGLTDINLPESLESIDEAAFGLCKSIISLSLPASLKSVGTSAFSGCSSITSVNIPANTQFGYACFENCSSLASVTFEDGIIEIPTMAFRNCTALQSVNFPRSVESINDQAFEGCSSISLLTFHSALKSIGINAFANLSSLKNVLFDSNAEISIGQRAFANCTALPEIFLSGVVSLDAEAFLGCTALKLVVGYSKLQNIGARVFKNCNNINVVSIWNQDPPLAGPTSFDDATVQTATLEVMDPYRSIYSQSPGWERFVNTININEPRVQTGALGILAGFSDSNLKIFSNHGEVEITDLFGNFLIVDLSGKTLLQGVADGVVNCSLPIGEIIILRSADAIKKFTVK